MYVLFEAAVENDILDRNPVKKSVKVPPGRTSKEKRVLSVEEQKIFLDIAYGTSNYKEYGVPSFNKRVENRAP